MTCIASCSTCAVSFLSCCLSGGGSSQRQPATRLLTVHRRKAKKESPQPRLLSSIQRCTPGSLQPPPQPPISTSLECSWPEARYPTIINRLPLTNPSQPLALLVGPPSEKSIKLRLLFRPGATRPMASQDGLSSRDVQDEANFCSHVFIGEPLFA